LTIFIWETNKWKSLFVSLANISKYLVIRAKKWFNFQSIQSFLTAQTNIKKNLALDLQDILLSLTYLLVKNRWFGQYLLNLFDLLSIEQGLLYNLKQHLIWSSTESLLSSTNIWRSIITFILLRTYKEVQSNKICNISDFVIF
jgi:hypothetical protein